MNYSNFYKSIFLFIATVFVFSHINAQKITRYEKQWKSIDSLVEKKNLPKSALQLVDRLYQKAHAENNVDQSVKALVYKLALNERTTDNRPSENVQQIDVLLQKPINKLEASLLWSLKAQFYIAYLNADRWRIDNKKDTFATKESDWATWTTKDFEWHIYHSFQNALKDSVELQNATIEKYPAIVIGKDRSLRPTLYDLTVQNAIDYYSNTRNKAKNTSKYAFILKDVAVLENLNDFLSYQPNTNDTLSPERISVYLYQSILHFHKKNDQINALLDADNQRIIWAYNHLIGENVLKDSLYIHSLKGIVNQYPNNPIALQSAYMVAKYYYDLADKYAQNKADTSFRYKRITAKAYIDQYFPKDSINTEGWFNLRILKMQIETPNIGIAKTEAINIPEKPILALVNTYLIKQLYVKIVATKKSDAKIANLDSLLKVRPAVQQFTQALPDRSDYQAFSTEIKIDGLPIGSYWAMISEDKDFSKSRIVLPFAVSQLAYFNTNGNVFVVDRETGSLLSGVRLKINDRDIQKHIDEKNSRFVSDENGHLIVRPLKANDGWYTMNGVLHKGNDSLVINVYRGNNMSLEEADVVSTGADQEALEEEREAHLAIRYVSDRNIYRPGQKLFFKAFIGTKDGKNTPYHIWKRDKMITIYLKDANREVVDSLKLKQDDFGTVNGSFLIPKGRLTGNFSLEDDWSDDDFSFKVEEYKRPTFFVETDSVKSAYRLGDSILISGKAIAYSGAKVSGAQVKVHVVRNTQFAYYWRRPLSFNYNTAEILDTVVSTDGQGKFQFYYKAIPDETIDSASLPVFQYRCTIDVTDPNGETRSADKQVAIGYQSVELHWNVSNETKLNALDGLRVSSKNTNGIAVPIAVNVTIRPVKNPNLLLRKKLWSQPDVQVMDSLTYKQYFPHDIYRKEDQKEYWEKGNPILDEKIASDSLLKIKNTASPGWYYLEATATSPEGKLLKDYCYVQLVKDGELVNDQYFQVFNGYYSAYVGDTVKQYIATAADKVHLVEMTVDKKDNPIFSFLTLDKGIKKYNTIIKDVDQHPLSRAFAFYKDNRYYDESLKITAMLKTEKLDVHIKTFRDKTEPGSKEKWAVRVNRNDSLTPAQLLSTMYDASLDQIQAGGWMYEMRGIEVSENIGSFNSNSDNVGDGWQLSSGFPYWNNSYQKEYPVFIFDKLTPTYATFNQFGNRSELDEVVTRKRSFTGAISMIQRSAAPSMALMGKMPGVQIRGNGSMDKAGSPLIIVDGKVYGNHLNNIDPSDIVSMNILKGDAATSLYGSDATDGVIVIVTKSQKYGNIVAPALRTNFDETAFFYPDLTADKEGNYWVEFQMPDAVTRWRWRNLAMDKEMHFGYEERMITSQKTLMVQPNMPRFLRAGDQLDLSMKVSNTGAKSLNGTAYIQLLDMDSTVLGWQKINQEAFHVGSDNSSVVHFKLDIPENYSGPLYVKTWAEGGNYSDGEMHEIPVLSRKTLVMDSWPFELKGDTIAHVSLDKLLESKNSNTIDNQNLVVQVATNPVWYVVQALPYLAHYNYECSEQLFNRIYAGFLGEKITAQYPQIQKVLKQWENDPEALKSNLQKNENLQQAVLEETPWVNVAQSEAAQKRQLALLYNKDSIKTLLTNNFEKLSQRQLDDGSFSWYDGNWGDRYITQYIVMQYAKLLGLNALNADWKQKFTPIINKAQQWLSGQIMKDYNDLKKSKVKLIENHMGSTQLQYLYATTMLTPKHVWTTAETYYFKQSKKYWNSFSNVEKAWIADLNFRKGDTKFAVNTVIHSLMENAVENKTTGLYWKTSNNYWWSYSSPIESHSQIMAIIETIAEKDKNATLLSQVQEMQHWLIRNKQTNYWYNTKATADACYATLIANKEWINAAPDMSIQMGDSTIQLGEKEVATGYAEATILKTAIKPALGNVTIKVTHNPGYVYGGFYWQYLENIDKVTVEKGPLSLSKKLYREVLANGDRSWQEIKPTDILAVGDKIMARMTISSERDLQYVHLKDLRPSNTEPNEALSGYNYQNGLSYYNSVKDISSNYFFSSIPKGVYVLEYTMNVTHSGTFASGLASIQCMYAPEFSSHSEGGILNVK